MTPSERILAEMRDAIKQSGMKQKDLADRLGVTQARVSQMLGSRNNLTLKTIDAVYAAIATS